MVGRPVRARKAGAIQEERDRQVLQGDFLKDLVKAALQKSAVDVHDGPQSGLGLPGGKGHGVRLADTRVKEPIGKTISNGLQLVSLAHGGRQHGYTWLAGHLAEDRVPGVMGEGRTRACLGRRVRAVGRAERGRRVEIHRVLRRRLIAVALFRHDVQEDGRFEVLDHLQVLAQYADVVPIHGANVSEPQLLEDHSPVQPGLDGLFQLCQETLHRIAEQRHLVEHTDHLFLQSRVEGVGAQPIQILPHAADSGADGHFVVVQDDQQTLVETADVVHRLEDDPRREGPVANHRHGISVRGAQQLIAAAQPHDGGQAATGVARHEQVVRALARAGVAHQAALGADCVELAVAARDQLVGIDLVSRVPQQPVARKVERGVQGDRQFHDAQIRGEVCAARRDQIAQHVPDLGCQFLQLGQAEVLDIPGRIDLRQQLVHECLSPVPQGTTACRISDPAAT